MLAISQYDWIGSAEQIEALLQFARDYEWGDRVVAEDVEWMADEVISQPRTGSDEEIRQLGKGCIAAIDLHSEAEGILRTALEESAQYSRAQNDLTRHRRLARLLMTSDFSTSNE